LVGTDELAEGVRIAAHGALEQLALGGVVARLRRAYAVWTALHSSPTPPAGEGFPCVSPRRMPARGRSGRPARPAPGRSPARSAAASAPPRPPCAGRATRERRG